MKKAIGTCLGILLARVVLPMLLGPRGMEYFSMSMLAAVAAFLVLHVWSRLKIRRLRREFCDEALFYARKKRQAFDDPDFQEDELREIRGARKRGDSKAVQAIIASANMRLLDQKAESRREASAQAQAQGEAERRRPAELRLYRA